MLTNNKEKSRLYLSYMTEEEQIRERIDKAAEELSEHVDSVQIIITHHIGHKGESGMYSTGRGCFYS